MQHRSSEASQRVEAIPGIGVIGATAIVATVADPTIFRSGRDFAAWIGLVPRQDSTGGKQKLGPISKQGDRYLRRILVVGAIAVLRRAQENPGKYPWLTQLLVSSARKRRGDVTAFTNCRGDEDIDAKRSRPSIGKPVLGHAKKERVSLFGTDQRITSGPAARRPHSKAEYMTAPERFADSQIPLAPRAPSIHDPKQAYANALGCGARKHTFDAPPRTNIARCASI